jgi:hypothetical protein
MRAFISQIIPQESMSQQKAASQAANNFCMSFLKSVNIDLAIFLIPIFIKKKNIFKYELTCPYKIIQKRFFSQKRIGIIFNTIIENISIFNTIRVRKIPKVWFYNLTIHNTISFILIKWIIKRKCYILFADTVIIKKKIDVNRFINWLIMKSDGIISLSHSSEFIKNHPNLFFLSGIIEQNHNVIKTSKINRKDILFSGYLRDHTGIHLALETFAKHNDLNLLITGRGDEERLVKEYSQKYSNIKYLGFLEFDEYLSLLNKIDIVLNLRDPLNKENHYNFPSKMIEYLNFGKIVVSTIEYPQIDKSIYFYSNYDSRCLINTLLNIISKDNHSLQSTMKKSNEFVNKNFSSIAWQNLVLKTETNNR